MAATPDLDGRLARAFRRVVGRVPTAYDLAELRRAHARQLECFSSDPDAARSLLAVGATPPNDSIDPVAHAALATTCLLILNLDEALTRE